MKPLSDKTAVTYPGPGCVVEFMQANQPQLAFVLEENSGQLRLYTAGRRETKLAAGRILPWPGPVYPAGMTREEILKILEEHQQRRQTRRAGIDAAELWGLASGSMTHASARWFAELLEQEPDIDAVAALGRALLDDKVRFKFQPPDFEIYDAERVEARLREMESARIRERLISEGQTFLQALRNAPRGETPKLPPISEETARTLEKLLTTRMADPENHETQNIWKELTKGMPENEHLPFLLLQAWGKIPAHYNFWFDRADYLPGDAWSVAHAEETASVRERLEAATQDAAPGQDRVLISIDSPQTHDIDDAFQVRKHPDGSFSLTVALANPGAFWPFGSPLDRAVLRRATSIYLPEGFHHMMPEALGTGIFSLTAGRPLPLFLIELEIAPDGEIRECRPGFGTASITANLTYEGCEAALDEECAPEDEAGIGRREAAAPHAAMLREAAELGALLQAARVARGAIIIERPDTDILLSGENGSITVDLRPARAYPRMQRAVSEIMIAANSAIAAWAKKEGLPLLHRTQDVALPREYAGIWSQPPDIARVVKALTSAILEVAPRPHAGIGTAAYCTVTSPLRRYADLLNEAQVHAWLTTGAPLWDAGALERLLPHLNIRLDAAGQVQRQRPRYWKLLYLQQKGDRALHEGIIAEENDMFVSVALPRYQLTLRGKRPLFGDKVMPGMPVRVRIGKVNPLLGDMTILEALEAD